MSYYGDEYGMLVTYLGGFAGHGRRMLGADWWRLQAFEDGLVVNLGRTPTFGIKKVYEVVRAEQWEDLEHVTFFDLGAQGTKANLTALGLFGVFGLAARRDVYGLVVGYPDGDVCFEGHGSVANARSIVRELNQLIPRSIGVLRFGWDDDATAAPANDIAAQLSRLAELHAAGSLTDEEFASAKAQLL